MTSFLIQLSHWDQISMGYDFSTALNRSGNFCGWHKYTRQTRMYMCMYTHEYNTYQRCLTLFRNLAEWSGARHALGVPLKLAGLRAGWKGGGNGKRRHRWAWVMGKLQDFGKQNKLGQRRNWEEQQSQALFFIVPLRVLSPRCDFYSKWLPLFNTRFNAY